MSSTRPEPHVAQQIRRDNLRIQNSSQRLLNFPNNIEQVSLLPGLNSDPPQVRSFRDANMLCEPAFYSSETINSSRLSNPLSSNRNTMDCQGLGAAEPSRLTMPRLASFPHSSDPASSSIRSAPEEQYEPRNLGNWRNSGSHQGCDWMVNYACSSVANESNTNSILVAALNNVSDCQHLVKPSYNERTDIQPSLNNPSGETATRESQRQLGEVHHPPTHPPLFQNPLQDIVKSASISGQRSEMTSLIQHTGHGIWVGSGNELALLPNCGNQSNLFRFGNASAWTNRIVDNSFHWNSALGFTEKKSNEDSGPLCDSSNRGLSLSLSSNEQPAPSSQFGESCGSDDLQSRSGISKDPQYSKSVKSILNHSFVSKDCGKPLQNVVVGIPSNTGYRNIGPLGPFTGYATILKSSSFLKPAQQLLDEFCNLSSPKLTKGCDVSERVSGDVSTSTSADAVKSGVVAKGSNSGDSSSLFYSSNENENSGDGGAGSSLRLSSQSDYQEKMAKFLYMQEEVTKRYKQYHQQIQMVVSSFESVAGLSSATPYISMALKSVLRHFRGLEKAILDQLKHMREVLGEDLSAPTTGTSGKLGTNIARLRYTDQSFQKNKFVVGGNIAMLEHQQQAWKPQRGLPERSVAILRAWLFEHFLHPYPTDADKHMLASQTGLSRNQVSNWFINARVRIWKPMVEEIHMLETKGLMGADQDSSKNEGTSAIQGARQPRDDQSLTKFGMPDNQSQCLEMGSVHCNVEVEEVHVEQWNQEKRSKQDCEITSSMDGTLMGFVPYRRGELVGGLGSVSLTLGLRQGVEGAQSQQQLKEEQQLRRQFGGQMFHDFAA